MISDGNKTIAVECKATMAPSLNRGTYTAIEDIKPVKTFIAAPVNKGYPLKKDIQVVSVSELINELTMAFGIS